MKKPFNGGIQKGTTAFDEASKKLDADAKDIRNELEFAFDELTMVRVINKKQKFELVGDDCFSFAPDGGAWFKDGKLVAAFECKKQGVHGNACERWWDNAVTAKFINQDVVYVTFCSGAGASEGEVLDKMRRKGELMMGDKFKFFMSIDGFSYDEMKAIFIDILTEIAEK